MLLEVRPNDSSTMLIFGRQETMINNFFDTITSNNSFFRSSFSAFSPCVLKSSSIIFESPQGVSPLPSAGQFLFSGVNQQQPTFPSPLLLPSISCGNSPLQHPTTPSQKLSFQLSTSSTGSTADWTNTGNGLEDLEDFDLDDFCNDLDLNDSSFSHPSGNTQRIGRALSDVHRPTDVDGRCRTLSEDIAAALQDHHQNTQNQQRVAVAAQPRTTSATAPASQSQQRTSKMDFHPSFDLDSVLSPFPSIKTESNVRLPAPNHSLSVDTPPIDTAPIQVQSELESSASRHSLEPSGSLCSTDGDVLGSVPSLIPAESQQSRKARAPVQGMTQPSLDFLGPKFAGLVAGQSDHLAVILRELLRQQEEKCKVTARKATKTKTAPNLAASSKPKTKRKRKRANNGVKQLRVTKWQREQRGVLRACLWELRFYGGAITELSRRYNIPIRTLRRYKQKSLNPEAHPTANANAAVTFPPPLPGETVPRPPKEVCLYKPGFTWHAYELDELDDGRNVTATAAAAAATRNTSQAALHVDVKVIKKLRK